MTSRSLVKILKVDQKDLGNVDTASLDGATDLVDGQDDSENENWIRWFLLYELF